jgi:hypothetical protein
LDNLGLTIKIGQANSDFAETLGKTVDELTAEEKQMALLNATLKSGGVLIEQVGGNTDAATDSFMQMRTAMEDAANTLKQSFYVGVSNASVALSGQKDIINDVADSIYVW